MPTEPRPPWGRTSSWLARDDVAYRNMLSLAIVSEPRFLLSPRLGVYSYVVGFNRRVPNTTKELA